MTKSKKKWIILAHCFNMDGRAASQTITDKIPFLMEKGIEPIVISAPTGKKDNNFVHHQILSPAPSGVIFEMRKIIEKQFKKGIGREVLKAGVTIICFPFFLVEKIFINLDSHWSWFISAGIKGIFVMKKTKPQLVYSTAGPSSTHLAGYILKRLFNIPWVAEIHDPLISESEAIKKRYQRYRFHRWLEKKIFQNASAVIYFTNKACENASERTRITGNSHVLRPGANPPETPQVHYRKRRQIHFGHFGSLASERSLCVFMEAIAKLIKKDSHLKESIVLDVYGTKLDTASKNTVRTFSLGSVVQEYGRLEFDPQTGKSGRHQVFEKMHLSDVLVLIHGHTDQCDEYIPSKLYEYLLTQRPIIGIASKESELASILTATGHLVVEPDSLVDIEAALKQYINQWSNDQLSQVSQGCPFTVEDTVEKLIKIVKSCP